MSAALKKPPPDSRVVARGVRLAYTDQLIRPKAFEVGQPEKFGCTLLLPPGHPALEAIERALIAVATARWGKRSDWPAMLKGISRDPVIKDCADYPAIGVLPSGWMFVRCSSQDAPGIVGPNVEEIAKQDLRNEVYSGRWGNVSIAAFSYDRQTSKGVALALGNVQLTKHDERLGASRPKAEDEFDPTDLPEDDDDFDEATPPPPTRRRR